MPTIPRNTQTGTPPFLIIKLQWRALDMTIQTHDNAFVELWKHHHNKAFTIARKEAAHLKAHELRIATERRGRRMSREATIDVMVVNLFMPEGLITVSSLGRWERRNHSAQKTDRHMTAMARA